VAAPASILFCFIFQRDDGELEAFSSRAKFGQVRVRYKSENNFVWTIKTIMWNAQAGY